MLQNSLHVNLLLTGIISRLAHYSQPLLRSLLLNHSLVLETNVKSLFQVKLFQYFFQNIFFVFILKILSNTQLNYSVISFLQQSISMDMSLLTTNDLSNQNQSTILITSTQQTSNTTGKTADIGMIY